MNELEKKYKDFKEFILSQPNEGKDNISDAEILMEGEDVKEPESVEKDDEKMIDLIMLQEFDDEKQLPEYTSLEEKYEEQLLLDHVERLVSKYMARGGRP